MIRGETFLILVALLAAAPAALAQESDPTVNESDFDESPPPSDESYLDEAEWEAEPDPTLSESDFDMGVPAYDEAYLDEGADASGGPAAGGQEDARSDAPAPGLLAGLAVLGLAALALRRR